jgi:hypothetical protein
MKKLIKTILVSILVLASGECVGDWTDAGWYVSTFGAESNVFTVVNMNKLSFRKYAFNRSTGALKHICWNTSKVEEFYINGESEVSLTMNGEKAKLEFVSVTENEDRGLRYLEPPKNRKGSDVLATVESLFAVPSEDVRVSVTYRFRRDNEVRVDCAVIAKRPLADDSRLSVAYPINRDYTKIVKNPKSSDEVQNVKLYRDCDKGPTLIFAARSRKGDEELRKGIFGAIFSSAPKARMEINLSTKANPLSPTHDRMLTLSAPLRDPETLDDGTVRYTFNFSIPLYEKD